MSFEDVNSASRPGVAPTPAPAPESPKPEPAPPAPPTDSTPPQIKDFDALIKGDVQNFVDLGEKIGGLVAEQVRSPEP